MRNDQTQGYALGIPGYQEHPRGGELMGNKEKAKRAPLPARIAAGVIVGAAILGGIVACGTSLVAGAERVECRAELEKTLAEAGSDRSATEQEIDACTRSN